MKIAIFSAYDTYGAGNAAYRLFKGIKKKGYDCEFYAQYKTQNDVSAIDNPSSSLELVKAYNQYVYNLVSPNNQHFSMLDFGIAEQTLYELVKDKDIINIHWVNGFISMQSLKYIESLGKKIIITLHDENFYTGGCHYRNECQQHLEGCLNCPLLGEDKFIAQREFAYKLEFLPKSATFISPSKWIAAEAKKSLLLRNHPIEVISNGINPFEYSDEGRVESRAQFDINEDEFVILFGAQSLSDTRKGFAYLLDAIQILKQKKLKSKLRIMSFGNPEAMKDYEIEALGYIHNEELLKSLYKAADVFVLPSLEDNLPNVMLESLFCGTPVVAFNIGGMGEVIQDGENGYLAKIKNSKSLAEAIEKSINHGIDRKTCRKFAELHFNEEKFVDCYLKQFNQLNEPKNQPFSYEPNALIYELGMTVEHYIKDYFNRTFDTEMGKLIRGVGRIKKASQKGKKIILFGYGKYGKIIESLCEEIPLIIVDSHKYTLEENVYAPAYLDQLAPNEHYILISVNASQEIAAYLQSKGYTRGVHFDILE